MKTRPYLFTSAEIIFYRQLIEAVDGMGLLIFPKVRLIDIIEFSTMEEMEMLNYSIMAKHVDFLVCSTVGVKPVAVIELDDPSHATPEARERDAVKNWACTASALPMLRFGSREPKRPHIIRQRLETVLKPTLRAVSV
jgi:hypothetical protein